MTEAFLRCVSCGNPPPAKRHGQWLCECGGSLELPLVPYVRPSQDSLHQGVWRYARSLPRVDVAARVSMGEGGTPLVRVRRLEDAWGLPPTWLKLEGLNPTGSFKDRGMTVAASLAASQGHRRMVCASTGNTAASAAAYANRAGLECVVYVPRGGVAEGKLAQLRFFGATIESLAGSFDDALRRVVDDLDPRTYLVNSVNPYRLEGQKTILFEVREQLGRRMPEEVWLPVGNGGNVSAVHKAARELAEAGLAEALPRLVGTQAAGANPLSKAHEVGARRPLAMKPETLASAIRIGAPANWDKALRAVRDSSGAMHSVTDDQIFQAQSALATLEGVWVEPASAAPLAALRNAPPPRGPIVVVATGNGLKDPASAAGVAGRRREVPLAA